jgi:hypothetical protein
MPFSDNFVDYKDGNLLDFFTKRSLKNTQKAFQLACNPLHWEALILEPQRTPLRGRLYLNKPFLALLIILTLKKLFI